MLPVGKPLPTHFELWAQHREQNESGSKPCCSCVPHPFRLPSSDSVDVPAASSIAGWLLSRGFGRLVTSLSVDLFLFAQPQWYPLPLCSALSFCSRNRSFKSPQYTLTRGGKGGVGWGVVVGRVTRWCLWCGWREDGEACDLIMICLWVWR